MRLQKVDDKQESYNTLNLCNKRFVAESVNFIAEILHGYLRTL